MSDFLVFDSDDMGANHQISDVCMTYDCRDALLRFKDANPKFKATLFAVPGEMTQELLNWSEKNADWIELAVHGFYHISNYECEKMTYDEIDDYFHNGLSDIIEYYFVKGFKAPGWQISDSFYDWLKDNKYWVADQDYNDERRPKELPVYKVGENSIHTHTWNCMGNGVYELFDEIMEKIKGKDFKFVSEVVE